jgi:hypothetical protein
LGVFAGHYELPPAEHPNAKTSSAARQAVAGESESNAKCGGGAVNSGDGIGCSTGSIGDSEGIPQGRLSQSFREAVARPSWNRRNRKKGIAAAYSSGCRLAESAPVKRQNATVSWYRKWEKAAWLNGESRLRVVIDSAGAFNRSGLTDSADLRLACNTRAVRFPGWHGL